MPSFFRPAIFSQLALLFSLLALLRPLPARADAGAPSQSLEFIQNKGQWDRRVRYQAALPAGQLLVRSNALTYVFLDPAALDHHGRERANGEAAKIAAAAPAAPAATDLAAHAYTVYFEGANARARLTAATPTAGTRNYFLGNDPCRWAHDVGAFRRLRYEELWPGIGLTLYENAGQHLEYDVLLAPGANPARVVLRYEGASRLTLDAAGNLLIATTLGTTTESAPRAWQTSAGGQRQPVACRYVLRGTTLSFALGAYDRRRALTIDPVIQFSTLTGATADNWGFTATYDEAGNMYSGGIVFGGSGAFPATPGAYRTSFSSVLDMALIKYDTKVSGAAARVWATYLGGSGSEFPHSLETNARQELTVLGSTSSLNYPTTTNALQQSFGGGTLLDPFLNGTDRGGLRMSNGSDLVVTRLSAAGNALLASTYLGGSANDGVLPARVNLAANYGDAFRGDVLLDPATNDVFVATNTASANFPGLSAATGFNPTYQGGGDAVLCRLSANLGAVRWAGLLGGVGADAIYSVQQDGQGRLFVCGGTTSAVLPGTEGAFQAAGLGGVDGFVARVSADGRRLERSTFVGTKAYDQAHFLQLDADGNAYLLGQTLGEYPRTTGLYGTDGGPQFIQKLNADLTESLYSTAFGAPTDRPGPNLVPTAFLVDDCERVYLAGWGGNVNGGYLGGSTIGLPTTAGAPQRSTDGSDFYLAEFGPGMKELKYATFFGQQGGRGEHVDGGTSRFDKRGIIYQALCAGCGGQQGFPVPPGASTYTTRNGSQNCNNGAIKVNFEVPQADPGPRRVICADAAAVALGGSPAGGIWTGPGVRAGAGGGYQFEPAAVGPGQYRIRYTVATAGVCLASRTVRYVVAPLIAPTFAPVPEQCVAGATLPLVAAPAGGAFSGPGVSGSRFSPAAAGAGTHTLTYVIADSLGCGTVTRQVVVGPLPSLVAGRDTALCADLIQPFQLEGFSPAGGTWSGTGVTAGGYFTPPNTNNRGGIYRLTYAVTLGACRATVPRQVLLAPANAQNVGLNLPVCAAAPQYGGLAPFDCPLRALLPGGTYVWDFGDGTPVTAPDTLSRRVHRYERPGSYRIRLTARYAGCEVVTQFAPLEVGEVFLPNIITPNGDARNETFRPLFTCQPASLKVFSRWGQSVFETDSYRNDWNASALSAGIYYYLLRDAEGRTAKGWVEVVK